MHHQCVRVLLSLYPYRYLLLFGLLMTRTLTGKRWNLSVVSFCIFKIASEVEQFWIRLLAIYSLSFENFLLTSLTHLLSGLLDFLGFPYT